MSIVSKNANEPRATLQTILRRVHLRVVLISVILIGICSIAIEVVVLRIYTINNLELVARSVGYTVEAAVVFNDEEAAVNILAEISSHNSVEEAHIVDKNGNNFASWKRFDDTPKIRPEQVLANLILPQPIVGQVIHDGAQIGEVKLVGYGRDILWLLLCSTGGVCLCFLLSSFTAYFLSRKVGQEIVAPIQEITHIAHAARKEHQFSHRVSAANIEELFQLGDDFNSLLSNLELWQAHVKLEKETLTYKTYHDPLTDLYNRTFFEHQLEIALINNRLPDSMLAVFYIDSDHFKYINDKFGHSVGDEVLCTIGLRLKAQVRGSDVVARLGGDEFAILINPLHDEELAARIAENIIASMKEPISLRDGNTIKSSLSIGIAFCPNHTENIEELVKLADKAMYQAKRTDGSTYQIAITDHIFS